MISLYISKERFHVTHAHIIMCWNFKIHLYSIFSLKRSFWQFACSRSLLPRSAFSSGTKILIKKLCHRLTIGKHPSLGRNLALTDSCRATGCDNLGQENNGIYCITIVCHDRSHLKGLNVICQGTCSLRSQHIFP